MGIYYIIKTRANKRSRSSTYVKLLNHFQDERFNAIPIDWKNLGGITIDKLANNAEVLGINDRMDLQMVSYYIWVSL